MHGRKEFTAKFLTNGQNRRTTGNSHESVFSETNMAIAAIFVAACASGLTGTQFPRRRILASAAAALTSRSTFSANAASGPAVDLLTTVSSLSLRARELQYFVREDVPVRVKAQRVRARRKDLDELLGAMSVAAPDLRLCRVADCECTPDAMLMDSAVEQVTAVRSHLVNGWVDGAEGAAASDLFALRVPELGLVADPGAPSQDGGSGGTSGRGKPTTKMEDGASAAAALVLTLSEACFGDSALVASRVWAERYRSLAVEGGALRRSPSHETLRIDCATVAAGRRSALWAPRLSEWGRKTARVAARFSDETRGVWVANLAERLAAERVGLEWAASFWQALHSCRPAAKLG